jgi:predicted PurR-regulated permease PerM
MTPPTAAQKRLRLSWVVLLTVLISFLFFTMIRPFIVTVLMAAILAGLCYPSYLKLGTSRLWRRLRLGNGAAAVLTILTVLFVIVVPLAGLLGIVAEQALNVSERVGPWVQQRISQRDAFDELLVRFPVLEPLEPYRDKVIEKAGVLAGRLGQFLVGNLALITRGAAAFIFHLFIMLYAMFFFLVDGKRLLAALLEMVPMTDEQESRMAGKFLSVSRATIKGTLVIGIVQGVLAGAAFWAAGVGNAVFWGTIMTVLSIIPGVGTALIWIPAVLMLAMRGDLVPAIGLTAWCVVVVGTADNFLRPRLVGKDTQMPDLLILLSTLGGLVMFGAVGIVLGPVIAALFLTIWDIFDSAVREAVGAEARTVRPG